MPLGRLLEQKRARRLIERMVQGERLPHALLFWGPPGVGKSAAAIELARWLNCGEGMEGPCGSCDSCVRFRTLEHPHFTYVLPFPGKALADSETGEMTDSGAAELTDILRTKGEDPYRSAEFTGAQFILIGQIRSMLQWVNRRPFTKAPRLALIDHADRLKEEAGNALLKLLEEPPPDFILVLTAETPEDILPTLRSRCQAVEFDRLNSEAVVGELTRRNLCQPNEALRIARLCGGNLSRSLDFASEPNRALEFHELAINIVRYALGRNPLELDDLIEAYQRLERLDQLLVLEIISTWLRDAAVLQSSGRSGESRIIHSDRLEWLQKFVANCPRADFVEATVRVDQARRHLEGNALAPLTLLVMARELYRAVYQKTPV